jgi:hypothetical protein
LLANCIIDNHHAFTLVEEPSFREFVFSLCPSFIQVSADTIRRDILSIFTDNLDILKSKLHNVPSHINFTQDLWTLLNNDTYTSFTAHWIDSDWQLMETMLDLKEVRGSHMGQNIAECFCESLDEFKVIPKVWFTFLFLLISFK